MAQTERHTNTQSGSTFPDLAAMGKKGFDDFFTLQAEQMERFQETNRNWIDRMQTEAKLGAEFAAKLTSARSIPEVATAYQEWASQHMEMAAEDAKRIFTESQKLAETGARRLSGGWQPNGRGGKI